MAGSSGVSPMAVGSSVARIRGSSAKRSPSDITDKSAAWEGCVRVLDGTSSGGIQSDGGGGKTPKHLHAVHRSVTVGS